MSARLEFKAFQIALLELSAANKDPESVHIPGYVRHGMGGDWSGAYAERKRAQQRREHALLLRRIAYLKRQHYLEQVREEEEHLYRLTSKAKFEILRLQFAIHMREQRKRPRDGFFYIIIFDIPEHMKKYRDFFRRILKDNGCRFLQFSIWMTGSNPQPAIKQLLEYLGLEKYFEIIRIPCRECSPRLQRCVKKLR